ncbi:MAG: carbohydrate ABC transporter permease [Clostridiaceae bacterium]
MKWNKLVFGILKYTFIAIVVLISTLPVIWVFVSSFKTNMEIFNSAFKLPGSFSLKNYAIAFRLAPIARFYLNSVVVSVSGTLLNLTAMGMAAYVFARFDFKCKNLLLVLFSITLLLPASALLHPLYLTISKLGLYNKLSSLVIVYAGLGIPVSLYVLKSYFLTIPKELGESANLDGAGFLRTFAEIILPVAKPSFGTAGVLQFLLCWNEFQFALVLTTGNENRTLPLALSYFTSMFSANYGAVFAATTMIIIPSIIIYVVLQEHVVSSLTAGAVKG